MALSSPNRYLPGATSVPVRLEVSDSDGVHQVVLFVRGFANREVVACRGVRGRKDAVVEFEYNGAIPSNDAAGLSDFPAHTFFFEALDLHGNAQFEDYTLAEISASNIATWKGHTDWVNSVSFSPDGTKLTSGSHDNTVSLWDVATRRNIAIFEVEDSGVWSVVFSPDGETLAVGTIRAGELWDVATSERIDVIEEYEYSSVISVAYSPGGSIMASATYDETVKLWDAATRRNLAICRTMTAAPVGIGVAACAKASQNATAVSKFVTYPCDPLRRRTVANRDSSILLL